MLIKIEKIIFEGYGLGHLPNGKPVFVKKSVPGDELEVEVIKDKKSYSEALIKKISVPSPIRREAPCPYFDKCGGCEHQNISYNNQLKLKEDVFKEVLERQGVKTDVLPIIAGSENEFYYRNSIRFFFVNNTGKISFARHHYRYKEGLVQVSGCLLQSKACNQILEVLQNFINEKIEHKSSFWQLKIREGKNSGEFMVEIITSDYDLPEKEGIVNQLTRIESIKSIYHTIAPGKSLKILHRRLIFGSPIITEKVGKFKFQISPESFFQTNSLGVKNLFDQIKEISEVKIGETVLDLYCGTGTIGIYLSTLAKKVVGVEVVKEAIRDAKDNARINKVLNCDFICADANEYLEKNKDKFDVVIVDPPRAGLGEDNISLINKTNSNKIVYVSCNPATFARDVKTFAGLGWKLDKVQPVDMFPQTHHIECVGVLKK